MKLKEFDFYHRTKIYGTRVNRARAKTPEEKEKFTRMLAAHVRSAKQRQRT